MIELLKTESKGLKELTIRNPTTRNFIESASSFKFTADNLKFN